ncbi:MAG: 3-isopropylmalate dehydratase small subunit [Candidatus Omnitrophica bacterium]|nr:3-isopropylmalate dehydratase small subunit [Candidatus Omnitrophota bacterium]MBI2173878.1 3-isopropylmalate dehydratase small subunit [Candidatus Omnitrophota bacterium]MBI3009850.1 3-isopropylmalate dehydratase small subunit [Candidatus Omnitrophota bacterium]
MKPFCSHRGRLVILDRANVDTDQIIPKQFLKSIARTGFGEHLFQDWRYLPDGKPNPDFALNQPRFQNASILVARNNFGCGSSREHAVWAIQQYGFQVVVAPWQQRGETRVAAFADIFRNNGSKNGLLTVELSDPEVNEIVQMVERFPGLEATVDLERQRFTLHLAEEISFHFDMDATVKNRLIHGLDEIGLTLKHEEQIRAFESHHNPQLEGV